jgi:branched-chain amino acid transport system permease protein
MEYVLTIGVLISIFVILASSYNLVIGYGGLASVAHPIFYALGAYGASLLAIHAGWPPPLAILAGGLVAVVASVLLALSALRVSGDYLLIASLGFQLGILQVIKNFEFTGGPGGLSSIPSTITGPMRTPAFLAISMAGAALTVWLISRIVHGPYGRAITAMRDEELAFSALGRNAMSIKIVVFAIGCGIAGIAGGLYAFYFQYVSPEQYEVLQSAAILTMVVLGGMGTTWGPVVGAILLISVPQGITFLNLPPSVMAPLQGIIFTSLVLLFLFWRPAGLVGSLGARKAVPGAAGPAALDKGGAA